jgi:hypothetical protein
MVVVASFLHTYDTYLGVDSIAQRRGKVKLRRLCEVGAVYVSVESPLAEVEIPSSLALLGMTGEPDPTFPPKTIRYCEVQVLDKWERVWYNASK